MNAIIQEDRTGCGIASVAVVAGVSYAKAARVARSLGIDVTDSRLWSETISVRKLLRHFKISAASKELPFTTWARLPNLALLAVKWHTENKKPYWHWVVFVREKNRPYVLDSKKALRHHHRTDFGRIKPKWFIRLQHPAPK